MAALEVLAPTTRLRREVPEHRLGRLLERRRGLKPMLLAGSRVSASAYSTAAAAEKRRAAAVSARLVSTIGTRAPTTRPAVCASAMKARFL